MKKKINIEDIVITRQGYIGKVSTLLKNLKENEICVGFGGASYGIYKIKDLIKVNNFLASAIRGIHRRTLKHPDLEKWNIHILLPKKNREKKKEEIKLKK